VVWLKPEQIYFCNIRPASYHRSSLWLYHILHGDTCCISHLLHA